MRGYREDLAYIHDAGSSWFALQAAPGLLALLRRDRVRDGLVVDLGCGAGQWAGELTRGGYGVLGIDQSAAMIRLARARAPKAAFRTASVWTARLPPCRAVTAIGEVLNYRFDEREGRSLAPLFDRVHRALAPGGLFVFDVAEPDRVPRTVPIRYWSEGKDWTVLVEVHGSRTRAQLTRRIMTFRRAGKLYRRSQEIHDVQLFSADAVSRELARAGFRVRVLRRYGRLRLFPGQVAFLARKP